MGRPLVPSKHTTSGYAGVSWHKAARKWTAIIRVRGTRHYLGLFETAEAAHRAYAQAAERLGARRDPPDPKEVHERLIESVKQLYARHGLKALVTEFLEKRGLYARLLKAGLYKPALLKELGIADAFATWKIENRTHGGKPWRILSWDEAVSQAKKLKAQHGDLPTVEWCRCNGHGPLTYAVHGSGRVWEDLRKAIGCKPGRNFCSSRNEMRWRSRPEACFSDFLYARGIEHKRGERYPLGYQKRTGRNWGQYDLHFRSKDGTWINVEIWGDPLNALSGGRYRTTRALKEAWHRNKKHFLGVDYKDCLSDEPLTEILKPYIGIIEPFKFDKPYDKLIQTSHWSDAYELLEECRKFAAQMPNGVFPSEDWLRKRGKYVNRRGPVYNTLAIRVNNWIGGMRKVRELLGHGHASTTKWTREKAITAWRDFEERHGVSPSQCLGRKNNGLFPNYVIREAARIYEAARSYGVLFDARGGRTKRKVFWTRERAISEWHSFTREHGRTPSQCMSAVMRSKLPRDVTDLATRIYEAARRLGVLATVRGAAPKVRRALPRAEMRRAPVPIRTQANTP